MSKKEPLDNNCISHNLCCCNIESIITIDNKGQIVLPKDVRSKLNLQCGDKLALISLEREGNPCCLALMKTSDLTNSVKTILEPLLNNIS